MDRYRIQNRPIRLRWAGWETDTYKLGSAGWEISAEQDLMYNRMRIAINHPKAQIQGITEIEDFHYRGIMEGEMNPVIPTSLRFQVMGQQVFINQMDSSEVSMSPIDFRPRTVENVIHSLSDLCNFTALELPRHELYLHEANINQILEMALVKQEPDQERIRQDMMRERDLKQMRMGKLHTELRLVA